MALFCVYELQSSVKGVKLILILHDQLYIATWGISVNQLEFVAYIYIYISRIYPNITQPIAMAMGYKINYI